jgi:ribosome-binding factor A
MTTHRNERVAEQLLATLSRLIQSELRDPSVAHVVLTHVKLTRDLQLARVYFAVQDIPTIKNQDPAQKLAKFEEMKLLASKGLQRAEGFLRHEIAQRMDMRRVPKIEFFYDESLAYGRKIEDLLREIKTSYPPSINDEGEKKSD